MPNIGPMEIVLLLGLALLLFGAKRLPEIGRSVGHGMREFKDSISGHNPTPAETHLGLDRIVSDADSGEINQVTLREATVTVRDHDAA